MDNGNIKSSNFPVCPTVDICKLLLACTLFNSSKFEKLDIYPILLHNEPTSLGLFIKCS